MVCNRKAFVLASGCPQVSVDLSFPDLDFCTDANYVRLNACGESPSMLASPDQNFPGNIPCISMEITWNYSINASSILHRSTLSFEAISECHRYKLHISFGVPCILSNIEIYSVIRQQTGLHKGKTIGVLHNNIVNCRMTLWASFNNQYGYSPAIYPPTAPVCRFTLLFRNNISANANNRRVYISRASIRAQNVFQNQFRAQADSLHGFIMASFEYKPMWYTPRVLNFSMKIDFDYGNHSLPSGTRWADYVSGATSLLWRAGKVTLPDLVTLTIYASGIFSAKRGDSSTYNIYVSIPEKVVTGMTGPTGSCQFFMTCYYDCDEEGTTQPCPINIITIYPCTKGCPEPFGVNGVEYFAGIEQNQSYNPDLFFIFNLWAGNIGVGVENGAVNYAIDAAYEGYGNFIQLSPTSLTAVLEGFYENIHDIFEN